MLVSVVRTDGLRHEYEVVSWAYSPDGALILRMSNEDGKYVGTKTFVPGMVVSVEEWDGDPENDAVEGVDRDESPDDDDEASDEDKDRDYDK